MGKKYEHNRLVDARANKCDEFYTEYATIEKEIPYYAKQFKGKVVYCNCDNPEVSNFWKYFHINFERLGIKELVVSFYGEWAYSMSYKGGNDADISVGEKTTLLWGGDFRSVECKTLLSRADIVVTNPPFSLFRDFVAYMEDFGKQYLIIGNANAVTYKCVYTLFMQEKIWLGVTLKNSKCSFIIPESYEGKNVYEEDGVRKARVNNTYWFTNMEHTGRHAVVEFMQEYSEEKYPKYENCDAINVDSYRDIPVGYSGVMGVPLTYMYYHNPDRFKIVGFRKGDDGKDLFYIKDGQKVYPYFRVLIKWC